MNEILFSVTLNVFLSVNIMRHFYERNTKWELQLLFKYMFHSFMFAHTVFSIVLQRHTLMVMKQLCKVHLCCELRVQIFHCRKCNLLMY